VGQQRHVEVPVAVGVAQGQRGVAVLGLRRHFAVQLDGGCKRESTQVPVQPQDWVGLHQEIRQPVPVHVARHEGAPGRAELRGRRAHGSREDACAVVGPERQPAFAVEAGQIEVAIGVEVFEHEVERAELASRDGLGQAARGRFLGKRAEPGRRILAGDGIGERRAGGKLGRGLAVVVRGCVVVAVGIVGAARSQCRERAQREPTVSASA
jgi:hypothetical protein